MAIDNEYGVAIAPNNARNIDSYVQKLQNKIKWAQKIAHEHNTKLMQWHKGYYNQKVKCMKLEVGDTVLVRIKAFGVDHKIADKWESDPYVVVSQMGEKPVFKVQKVGSIGTQNCRVVHRNMLYPMSNLRPEERETEEEIPTVLTKANILME